MTAAGHWPPAPARQLVALACGVGQAEDLGAEHRRDGGAAEALEPHRRDQLAGDGGGRSPGAAKH
jgi:hypothetical protein